MEEFKDIVDFLLRTPPGDLRLNGKDIEKALTTLSEILKTFNSQNSKAFSECIQRTLNLIDDKINTSGTATKCSLLVLNFLFSNNYPNYQILVSQTSIMSILNKLSNEDFHEMLQTHFNYVHHVILNSLRTAPGQEQQPKENIDLALKNIHKLAKTSTDQQLIRKYLVENELITKLIPLLFSDIKEQRKLVISIIMAVTSTSFSFTTVTTVHIQALKYGLLDEEIKYVKKIEGLLRLNDDDWHQTWCCVIRLFGLELHKGGPLYVNALLEVLEEAFKSSSNSTRVCALQCWQELILNFAIDIDELCAKKRIKLLLIPLKANNCKSELVAVEKFKTWWLLLCKMSSKLFDFIDEALIPFLNFCFAPTLGHCIKREENLYLGGRYPMVLPRLLDALLQLIGHRTKNCQCNLRVPQGNSIDINRDNLLKISKHLIKTVNQATFLVAKLPELQKSVDCMWYSLLQLISKDKKNGIREEFINNAIEIIDKLLAKNCVDIAAVIFELTIIEKAWLFNTLDHEIQYIQNMADKRKLIFSIKKPAVLYDFMNVLLEAGGGDSSVEMVNKMLFNVNFLLSLSEAEVYNHFLFISDIVIKFPRVIKPFLCTPIEYLRRETQPTKMLNEWIELYRQFFCDYENYPLAQTVDFCVYLETVSITSNVDVLIGNILNICIPKLNIMSVPNICIEKILKVLQRLIKNDKCLVLNSFNKLLKVFYMNYGAISIIFKWLSDFLKFQQNLDDTFNVLSTIGDIIAKVSTDTFLLSLILTSLKNFANISPEEIVNENVGEETKEIQAQIENLIKKCKTKLNKPQESLKLQNRSAKMVAMSTSETPLTKIETKVNEKIVPKSTQPNSTPSTVPKITESQIFVIPTEKLMEKPPTQQKVESKNGPTQNNTSTIPPSPPLVLNLDKNDKATPILRRLPPIYPKPSTNKPNEFVVVSSNWKFNPNNLTENQKEKMKERGKDIPALYQDLSQSNSEDIFKTFEPDENVKENLLSFKNAISNENNKTQQTVVPPVEEKKPTRGRRRSVTRVQKPTDNNSVPSTSSSPNIPPILENIFANNARVVGDESKLKIRAERELKKLQIDCNRSLTVMGTAEKKTLRSRELNTPTVPILTPGNEPIRKRKRSAKNLSPPQLTPMQSTPHDESEELIESSQETSTSKINCMKPILEKSGEVEQSKSSEKLSPDKNVQTPSDNVQKPGDNVQIPGDNVQIPGDNVQTPGDNAQTSDNNVQLPSENSPKNDPEPSNNVVNSVNKLHSIIENNFSEVQSANADVDCSIPTTAEVTESTNCKESNVYDIQTETITDDFVENEPANVSFVEYKNADNSVLATSMMSSPNHQQPNDDEKTQEFLNSTLNISPIKETTNDIVPPKENKSPEVMFSDEEEKNQQPTTSAGGSESLIDFNVQQSPSSKRKLHRARGRTAQLLGLLPDSGDNENSEMLQETMKPNFKSNNFLTFEKELPSPLAKPSTSIMKGGNKRKQTFDLDGVSGESDSPKCKRKRVSFHDPPVSCEKQYVPDIQKNSKLRLNKVFKKSQKSLLDLFKSPLYPQQVLAITDSSKQTLPSHSNGYGGDIIATTTTVTTDDQQMTEEMKKRSLEIENHFGELAKDDFLIEPPTESQGSVDNIAVSDTLNNVGPFFPELVSCSESIDKIFIDLTSPLWATSLKTILDERQIYTIGQFAALSELELNRLPLREHKINNTRMALSKYLSNQIDAEKMTENQTSKNAEVSDVKRGVKRKRRFSLSLLEKDREEMSLETKEGQLDSIFYNCRDPNEMNRLLNKVLSIVGIDDFRKCIGTEVLKYDGVNKSLETSLRYAVSSIGGDSTYERCVYMLKTITGVDYTADVDDVQDTSVTSMTNTSMPENEEKLFNTAEMCVKMINSTAESVCERLTAAATTLIQTATAISTSPSSSSSKKN